MRNKELIKRLENNHYALEKAYQRLQRAIGSYHDQEIYTATGELLLWVMTTHEWHKKHNKGYLDRLKKSDKGKILLGLLHAYNSMKHNMDFIKIHNKVGGGLTFPITFPAFFPPAIVCWIKAGDVLEGKYPSQKKNYEKFIEGKEVLGTFELAIEFLKEEYKNIEK
ncbi:hypothetical protein ACNR9V_03305 [Parageobacillus thermoglucosidasius]